MTKRKARLLARAEKAGSLPEGPLVAPWPEPMPEIRECVPERLGPEPPPDRVVIPGPPRPVVSQTLRSPETEVTGETLRSAVSSTLILYEQPVTLVTKHREGTLYALQALWQERIERMAEARRVTPEKLIELELKRAWTAMPLAKRGP